MRLASRPSGSPATASASRTRSLNPVVCTAIQWERAAVAHAEVPATMEPERRRKLLAAYASAVAGLPTWVRLAINGPVLSPTPLASVGAR